jgi:hypothetical protein
MELRVQQITRFKVIYIFIEIMDVFGLGLYATRMFTLECIAFELFHLRIVLFVYIFMQLRTITLVKDQVGSILEPEIKLKKLTVHAEKNSIYCAPTINSFVGGRIIKSQERETTIEKYPTDTS